MGNYTSDRTLSELGGRTATELANEVGCHTTSVYLYMRGKLTDRSKHKAKIDQLLGKPANDPGPSVKDLSGFAPEVLAKKAGVSRATVFAWRKRKIEMQSIRQPIDAKIEAVLSLEEN